MDRQPAQRRQADRRAGLGRARRGRARAGRVADRFDVVVAGSRVEQLVVGALDQLEVQSDRAVVVGVEPSDLEAARAAGAVLAIGVARGKCSPEHLRRAGADAVVADLQELLGPT